MSHISKIPRTEQFYSGTDDDIQIQPQHINTGHRQPMKMRMYNQHNSHAEQADQDDQKNGFGTEIPSKFLSGFK